MPFDFENLGRSRRERFSKRLHDGIANLEQGDINANVPHNNIFETLYDTGIVKGYFDVKFTKIVKYNGKTFRMKYFHYYNPLKSTDTKCSVSVLTQNGEWAVIGDTDEFPAIPHLNTKTPDVEDENKAITMMQDFIKAVYQ